HLKLSEKWLFDETLLSALKKKYRLAIFTGRPKRDAWDALNRFGKEALFETVITDDDVKQRKPDPEGLFLACEQLGTTQAIYFGDSIDDAEAARRASVIFIGVAPPGGTKENLQRANVSKILDSINNIEEVLCLPE